MKRGSKVFLGIACFCIGVGILLSILGIALGGSSISHANANYGYTYKAEDIQSIKLDVKYGHVSIKEGDEFAAEISNVVEDGFQGYVEEGTWYLKQSGTAANTINFFGIYMPLSFGFDYDDYNPKIVITVPADFMAENLVIDLGAGEIEVEELNTKNAEFDIGAGSMEIRRLNVTDKISCEVGAGELVVKKLQAKNADFECGVGSMRITGEILGDLYADCGMGEIQLDLNGNEDDYNYDVSCGIGDISLNDHHYSFSADDRIRNKDAIGTYKLNCSVGSLQVTIK